jgi:hypothetical protein
MIMKERFNLTILSGAVPGAAQIFLDSVFTVDLRRLIPVSLRARRFILRSSFSSDNAGITDHGAILVYANFPQPYSRNTPFSTFTFLGSAAPVLCELPSNGFCYSFTEGDCCPVMIAYPENSQISVRIQSLGEEQLNMANIRYRLTLGFELLDED